MPSSVTAQHVERYRARFTVAPDWAFPLQPSVPFVGRDYAASAPRIAVYASAENLTHYERGAERPPFTVGELAWDRHRGAFEHGWANFFPYLHIAPVENGSLLCAALYLVQEHVGETPPSSPAEFAERLVIANLGKFSIRTEGRANRDYAGDAARLEASLPYFRADLEILRPDVILLPRAMHRHRVVAAALSECAPAARVLPVPQFNATVVNVHLARHAERAAALRVRLAGTTVAAWVAQLRGYAPGSAYRYLAEIDEVMAASRGGGERVHKTGA